MSTSIVPPVASLLKSIESGIKLAKRTARFADSARQEQTRVILESSPTLQSILQANAKAIIDAYAESSEICGQEFFSRALSEDQVIQAQFKDLRIKLFDRIEGCWDFDEESFEVDAYTNLGKEVQQCRETCVRIFSTLRDNHFQASFQGVQQPAQRRHGPPKPERRAFPFSPDDIGPWIAESSSHSGPNDLTQRASFEASPISPRSILDETDIVPYIPKEIVQSRIAENEAFLERRRQSRVLFQNELRKSVGSLETRNSEISITDSRLSRSSSSTYDSLVTRKRIQGQYSHATRSSVASSDRYSKSPGGQELSSPRSPPANPAAERRTSDNIGSWGSSGVSLSSTLRVPGFGAGIEPGLEVLTAVGSDNEKMLVGEDVIFNQSKLPVSMNTAGSPISHDASFFRLGGFCEGATSTLRGQTGFKVVKKPSGIYGSINSARCVTCSYEVALELVEKDKLLSRDGIYGNCGIRWRQRFLWKSHIKTNSIDEPFYACVFCIQENKTIEEHDATVFFSVKKLFQHLARHSRPLPDVPGVITIYGHQDPNIVDFDIHLTSFILLASQFSISDIASKLSNRPAAQSTATFNPKAPTGKNYRDPDGNVSLQFAAGARIVGITYPDRYGGAWATGYHDGDRGSFPADKISLQIPGKDEVLMNSTSTLNAMAKWDFKPKDAKDGRWLKFSKGDRINMIDYRFIDQWCWSGQNTKGKWGLFPAAFVRDLQDSAGSLPQLGPSRSSSSKSAFSSIMSMTRNKSRHERSGSVKSTGSGGPQSPQSLETGRFHGWKS
ncbi:hypothetical protein HYALB_00013297 [Hymenoscyphus albidus]|uniref:SH3 domain-containing protein n=1 Tax=Hymenoscyphus albidus TaxID=595503 RepID=A0A9N9LQL2_9HELO|nr:hypothetical protein HYALB_00013297 [Hymenoscyphus albidus]